MALLLKSLMEGVWCKTTVFWRSALLRGEPRTLSWNRNAVRELATYWREQKSSDRQQFSFSTARERNICESIRKETTVWNRNNVTRSQAYWNLYRQFPELHWALLAHLVSRNGGWSMTDLQGEWLTHLLGTDEREKHFQLLETCNALIFRDAYPQLKLYAESRRTGNSLLHLLPYFEISAFMLPLWSRFWTHRESVLLTVGLIVNEQNVIQGPVIEDSSFRDLLNSLSFRSQPILQTNQVLFPMLPAGGKQSDVPLRLAGRVLEHFKDLHERIAFGKDLYAMLFSYPKILSGTESFAQHVPHTGSRADYWPQRFYPRKTKTGGISPKRDNSAGESWYSPLLETAWPDQRLPAITPKDWFADPGAALSYLSLPRPPQIVDMTFEHLLGQRKLQAAAEAVESVRD